MAQVYVIGGEGMHICPEQLRLALAEAGHSVWQESPQAMADGLRKRERRLGLLGSGVVAILTHTGMSLEEVALAQELGKPLVVAAVDGSPVPAVLAGLPVVRGCEAWVTAVVVACESLEGEWITLLAQLSRERIAERLAGITALAQRLAQNPHQPMALGHLHYLAEHDWVHGIKEAAQTALQPYLSSPPAQNGHVVGVRCRQHHISWYDKREICSANSLFKRQIVYRGGERLTELLLPCTAAGCTEATVYTVDCEGYV